MSWHQLPDNVRALAEQHLTAGQLQILQLGLEYPEGQRFRPLALRLGLARTTVIDRWDAAHRALQRHGVYVTEHGTYHLRETA